MSDGLPASYRIARAIARELDGLGLDGLELDHVSADGDTVLFTVEGREWLAVVMPSSRSS